MRLRLNDRERQLVLSKDLCRLSTINPNGWPHVVPVGFIYVQGKLYIPSDRRAEKIRNLARNNKATLLVDDELVEHGLMLECRSKIIQGRRAEPMLSHMREMKGWQKMQLQQ